MSKLTALDTCDKGENAAAQTLWEKEGSPGSVQLCGHHTRENLPTLLAKGFRIVDATEEATTTARELATDTVSA